MSKDKAEEARRDGAKEDRDAILSRRKKLIAAALAGFAATTPMACVCLSVEPCLDIVEDADVDADDDDDGDGGSESDSGPDGGEDS